MLGSVCGCNKIGPTNKDGKREEEKKKKITHTTTIITAVAGSHCTVKWCSVYKNEIFDFLI